MTIIYVHGVKVRSEVHGQELEKPFRRWLGAKLSVNGAPPGYEPVYWGDLAAHFRWNLDSRPRTKLLHAGGAEQFPGLGSLREAGPGSLLDRRLAPAALPGPVLGRPGGATETTAPPLSAIPADSRADFVADLYLACRVPQPNADPIADYESLAALADAAASVAARWNELVLDEPNDDLRAQRLVKAVDLALSGQDILAPMGGIEDWISGAGETLRRAAAWPNDAISTVFAELRPTLHEFIAHFVGDVFTYLKERGEAGRPGRIPQRVLATLRRAQARKRQTGEKIVIVSHSMGGQLVYDTLAHFVPADPLLQELEVDHWFTCGAQVSLFAEMRLFLGQAEPVDRQKIPRPACVAAWTNYFDLNDLVGFIMEPVFQDVKDLEYDTGYGLAFAHTGFLARPSFFRAMAERL